MAKKEKRRKPDTRRFVQIEHPESVGLELTKAQAWVGIDQQVGHGSADALFALTDEEFVAHLRYASDGDLIRECWEGAHPDRLLYFPTGSWIPENWSPKRARRVPPRFGGELWRHVDALGARPDEPRAEVSRALSAGGASYETEVGEGGAERIVGITLPLTGEGAYPRPGALVTGREPWLDAGSSAADVRRAFGDPLDDGAGDDAPAALEFGIEGDRVRAVFDAGGLAALVLAHPAAPPFPSGVLRTLLSVLGAPEYGPDFEAAVAVVGRQWTRRMVSPTFPRRVLAFASGAELQVENGAVISVQVPLDRLPGDVDLPRTRAELRARLGTPRSTAGGIDLYRFGECEVYLESPHTVTMVPCGVSVSHRMFRGFAGDYSLFLDVLGASTSAPIARHVQGMPGVKLAHAQDRVAAVTIGTSGYTSERFSSFIEGMPAEPVAKDLPYHMGGWTRSGAYAWDDGPYGYRVVVGDDLRVRAITLSVEPPRERPRR